MEETRKQVSVVPPRRRDKTTQTKQYERYQIKREQNRTTAVRRGKARQTEAQEHNVQAGAALRIDRFFAAIIIGLVPCHLN